MKNEKKLGILAVALLTSGVYARDFTTSNFDQATVSVETKMNKNEGIEHKRFYNEANLDWSCFNSSTQRVSELSSDAPNLR